jgi:hypothetical protein
MGTTFGANDVGALVAQLNAWAPQVESAIQQIRGSTMIIEGQLQHLAEGGVVELNNVIIAFRGELDMRSAARAAADEMLKEELRGLVMRVHEKFVEVERAVELLRFSSAPVPSTTASAAPATSTAASTAPATSTAASAAPATSTSPMQGASAAAPAASAVVPIPPDPWAAAAAASRQSPS